MLAEMLSCWEKWSSYDLNVVEHTFITTSRECDFEKTLDRMIFLAEKDDDFKLAETFKNARPFRKFNWYDKQILHIEESRPNTLIVPSVVSQSMERSATLLYNGRDNIKKYYARWIYLIVSQLLDKFEKSTLNAFSEIKDTLTLIIDECCAYDEEIKEFNMAGRNHRNRLLPYGPIYKMGKLDTTCVQLNFYSFTFILFSEMQYILANFQMRETTV